MSYKMMNTLLNLAELQGSKLETVTDFVKFAKEMECNIWQLMKKL